MKLKEISKDLRPRERLIRDGVESLTDYELLALILRTGTKERNVLDLSKMLLSKYELKEIATLSVKELMKEKGIGKAKACEIICISELVKRYNVSKKDIKLDTATKVYEYMKEKLENEKEEYVYVLLLNTKNMLIKSVMLTKGTLDSSLIHPREVFKVSVRESAAKIILVHNHPSGDTNPSKDDIEVTKRIKEIGETMQIPIVDHIIIGKGYYSFNELGMI